VSAVFSQFPFIDGIFQWSAWPFFYGNLQNVSNQADVSYLYLNQHTISLGQAANRARRLP
jgi:hypothetical protein